ncbi:MAG: Hachiman antiphage defense system protein HamA [Eubacteriales bacterium]
MKHIEWLKETDKVLNTPDGRSIQVYELAHNQDDDILSEWAKHFRNHYCKDNEIDSLREGTGYSREEFLINMKFPDEKNAPGPSIRAGDFGEILIADYLEYISGYYVPRIRYCDKAIRNESTKGCDVIGFKLYNIESFSTKDILAIYEVKAKLTGNDLENKLQEAVDDSLKDVTRKGESLNYIKQHFLKQGKVDIVSQVARFQNPEDKPYQELFGAAALFSTSCYNDECITNTDTSAHPTGKDLKLIVVYGKDMMDLVKELYRRAANEA